MKAILLAAGMGTRLRPLTLKTPKSLIKINDKPLLERQIEMLNEIGIKEIIVVTGYLKESFEYLKDKYKVRLVHNEKFKEYNNIYTMYLVREYLKNSYVIDADVYLNRNFLKNDLINSSYFAGEKKCKDEWCLHYDENKKVYNITVESGTKVIMSGVSYWSKEDAKLIVKKLEKKVDILLGKTKVSDEEKHKINNLYWDDIVKENLNELDVYIEKINGTDWFEIDNLEELKELEEYLKSEKAKNNI